MVTYFTRKVIKPHLPLNRKQTHTDVILLVDFGRVCLHVSKKPNHARVASPGYKVCARPEPQSAALLCLQSAEEIL